MKKMIQQNYIRKGIIVCLCIFFLVLTINSVSADNWSVDTENEWDVIENTQFNTTINSTGLRLNWSSWYNL